MRTTLGLGTVAVAAITTSPTDTTAGRVLKVGDFGLGLDAVAVADANTVPASGFYRLEGGSGVNGPLPGIFFTLVNYRYGTTSGAQIATRLGDTSGRTWVRAQQANVWSAWVELWTSSGTNAITVDTGSLGYGIGSGGAVTQATSKSTTVTLNKPSGRVTTAADSLAGGASVVFLLNNSKIAAGDVVLASIASAPGASLYEVSAWGVTAGLCYIRVKNIDAAAQAHAVAINFVVIKGAIA